MVAGFFIYRTKVTQSTECQARNPALIFSAKSYLIAYVIGMNLHNVAYVLGMISHKVAYVLGRFRINFAYVLGNCRIFATTI